MAGHLIGDDASLSFELDGPLRLNRVQDRLLVTGRITEPELARELAARLEDHKVPPQISVVESFPLSVNGKVDKRRLAEVVPA